MSCERYEDAIGGGACGAPLDARARAHLVGCPACRARLAADLRRLEEAEAGLRAAMAIAPSPGFVGQVLRGVEPSPAARRTSGAWWAVAAACLAGTLYVAWPEAPAVPALPSPTAGAPPAHDAQPGAGPPDGEARSRAATARVPSPPRTGAAGRPLSGTRQPRTRVEPADGRRDRPDLEVLVAPEQGAAIARLKELLRSGTLDESTLPPPPSQAELVIEPLAVPEIRVPDVWTITGSAGAGPGAQPHQ